MGRPKGSKNKPKNVEASAQPVEAKEVAVKKKGRPAGVKAAEKEEAPAKAPTAVETPVEAPETSEAPKRRGRPPGAKKEAKVVAPVLPTKAEDPAPPASKLTIVRTDTADEAAPAPVVEKRAEYTLDDLMHPALDDLEHSITELANLASPRRKVHHESRSLPGVSYERSVLKTLIDYFEVDVKKYIADQTSNK